MKARIKEAGRKVLDPVAAALAKARITPNQVTMFGLVLSLSAGASAAFGDFRLTTALLEGRAGPEIVRYAREQRIDLIVLGTHGRTGLTRALLGSVAEYVVRLAPCLVLTVPAGLFDEAPAAVAAEATAPASRPCLVCSRASDDLICETCRNRIRAEALHDKQEAERPGRRGLSV